MVPGELTSLVGRLLPSTVATSEVFTDPPMAAIYPVEHEAVASAVEHRRREFRTGRWCAREALAWCSTSAPTRA